MHFFEPKVAATPCRFRQLQLSRRLCEHKVRRTHDLVVVFVATSSLPSSRALLSPSSFVRRAFLGRARMEYHGAYTYEGEVNHAGQEQQHRSRRLDVEKSFLKFKTRICLFWLGGNCPYAERCMYAHGNTELRLDPANDVPGITPDTNPRYRTRLCKHFMNSNGMHCPHGIRCAFAHGLEELAHYTRLAEVGVLVPSVAATAEGEEIPAAATGIPHITPAATTGPPASNGGSIAILDADGAAGDEPSDGVFATSTDAAAGAVPTDPRSVASAAANDSHAAAAAALRGPAPSAGAAAALPRPDGLSVDTLAASMAGMLLSPATLTDPRRGSPPAEGATPGAPDASSPLSAGGVTPAAPGDMPSRSAAASMTGAPALQPGDLQMFEGLDMPPQAMLTPQTLDMMRRMTPTELAAFLKKYYAFERVPGGVPTPPSIDAYTGAPATGRRSQTALQRAARRGTGAPAPYIVTPAASGGGRGRGGYGRGGGGHYSPAMPYPRAPAYGYEATYLPPAHMQWGVPAPQYGHGMDPMADPSAMRYGFAEGAPAYGDPVPPTAAPPAHGTSMPPMPMGMYPPAGYMIDPSMAAFAHAAQQRGGMYETMYAYAPFMTGAAGWSPHVMPEARVDDGSPGLLAAADGAHAHTSPAVPTQERPLVPAAPGLAAPWSWTQHGTLVPQ